MICEEFAELKLTINGNSNPEDHLIQSEINRLESKAKALRKQIAKDMIKESGRNPDDK